MARLLVADDAMIVRKLVCEMLADGGHEIVAEATTGFETVALWEQHRPDISLIDVNMPELDGFDAAAAIHAIDPHARLIVASVLCDPARLVRARTVRALDYLVKPFEPGQLLHAVESALRDEHPAGLAG